MVQKTINLEQFAEDTPSNKSRLHGGCGSCGSGKAGEGGSCGNGLEKIYPTTAVRFGYMRYIGEYSHAPDMKFTCGAKVVIQTRRGIEIGEQVSQTCHGCSKSVTREQMKDWVARCGEDSFIFGAGRILREATAADLAEYAHIQQTSRQQRNFCQELSKRHKLPLKVIDCEPLFGGERIIFYFSAAERVDFRAMVKDLAQEYRTRIEMRQIGARDEARLLADYETCGREICCKVFLKTLRPVSMRMAKQQKATLDPSQVSGRCGRLKCCLRYEHVGYEELDKLLPRNGVRIRTAHGEGIVVNRQILTQLVQIRTDENQYITVVVEDIQETNIKARPPQDTQQQPRADHASDAKQAGREAKPQRRESRKDNKRSRQRDGHSPQTDQNQEKNETPPSAETPSSATSGNKTEREDNPQKRRRRRRRKPKGPSNRPPGGSGPNPPTTPGNS